MNQKKNEVDAFWMRRALSLAERGRFKVSPNPMVGACVVKNGRLIAEGYHECFGEDHAEVRALKAAGSKAHGASLYVTLEPCSSWGKTPPCTEAIVKAGIREVISGASDPNPRHHGRANSFFKSHKIKIRSGVLLREAEEQNEFFFKFMKTKMPFVTLKMAQTLDGKIATRSGKSRWITSPASREFVHFLRAENDAVLVGKNTLFQDNPRLSTRLDLALTRPGKPWRMVLDPEAKAAPRMRIFSGDEMTFQVIANETLKKLGKAPQKKKQGNFISVSKKNGKLNLKELLQKLGELGVAKLLVEGGGETAASFIQERLVDKLIWIVAPRVFGGRSALTSVEGEGVSDPDQAFDFHFSKIYRSGEDLVLEARPN